jgi:hypothetical protein
MKNWIVAVAFVLGVGVGLFFLSRPTSAPPDPEARIVAYLKENVQPGQPVLVTDLYNNVFTNPEEREALERMYDAFFRIPATAAEIYSSTGRLPSLEELSRHFQFKVPGELEVLLRVMESDPRAPRFFTRDPATGEITSIDVDAIAADERFGKSLRSQPTR